MIAFRDATEADLPAVVRLLADDRLGTGRERNETSLPDSYARGFRAMLAQGGRLMVAEQDGAVVGCLQFNVIHGVSQQGRSRAQVEGVRVDIARRGGGIGTALMRHAMAEARAAGCGLVQLTTNSERVKAQRFYTRLGFTHSHAGMKLSLEDEVLSHAEASSLRHLATYYFSKTIKLISLIVGLCIFLLYSQINLSAFDAFGRWITDLTVKQSESFGPLLIAFALGLFAFAIRRLFFTRPFYAVVEIYFGIVGTAIALLLLYKPELLPLDYRKLAPEGTKYPIYIGLASSIYVIVRGLDTWFTWFSQPIPTIRRSRSKAR